MGSTNCATFIGRKVMKLIKIILAMAGLVATPIVTIAGEDSQLTINAVSYTHLRAHETG